MSRPSVDEYYLRNALLVASRATCARRAVGCVLVNDLGHVLSTGYNGKPRNMLHCTDAPCLGAYAASGTHLDKCQAVHAEQNALLQCKDTEDIYTAYITASPCITCVKMLLNTSCQRIVFAEQYPHGEAESIWSMVHTDGWIHLEP